MQIKTIKVGSLETNCYLLVDELTKEAVVIDPGAEANKIIPELVGLKVKYIILTHSHPDHFGALDQVKQVTGAKTLWHQDVWAGQPEQALADGDEIKFGQEKLKVIHTPGHAKESICLYTPGYLFSGDTLFSGTYGRVDLPGSSPQQMVKSLFRLAELPDETIVYPGHDEATSIAKEKERGTLG